MTLRDRIAHAAIAYFSAIDGPLGAGLRAFVLGSGVVSRVDQAWGSDPAGSSPAEYGDYIATSNGVYACATTRAELLSSLPLRLYKLGAQGKRTEQTSGVLYELLQKVNPFWTLNRLINMTELTLCLWGKCFWFIERGESMLGKPKEIWWARGDRVKVFPHPEKYIDHFEYTPVNAMTPIPFAPSETIWFRYPDPRDEFNGLSPIAASRIAADYASVAWKSNRNLFANGLQIGGVLSPKEGTTYTAEQAADLEEELARRFKGVDKAHRWAVLRFEAEMKSLGFNPKEAEFLGGIKLSLEDICRAYKVPIDLVGGQRTYENYGAALAAIWDNAVLPEARFIGSELTEQFLPMTGEADLAEFDASGVRVLQEREAASWLREKEQITAGVITINDWRESKGKDKKPWGDAWWAPISLVPIVQAQASEPPPSEETAQQALSSAERPAISSGSSTEARLLRALTPGSQPIAALPDTFPRTSPESLQESRVIEFGSAEHERLWQRFVRRSEPHEKQFGNKVADLFRRQRDSVKAKLTGRTRRDGPGDLADHPFDMAEWVKKFRTEARPILLEILKDAGAAALEDLALSLAFDVQNPLVIRFLERRAQRFAKKVNETTWEMLKESLSLGIKDGESIAELAERVEFVMGDRIRSSGEEIARTEVIGATNGGTLLAYEQSGVVKGKTWLAALDERTRETHLAAHNQTVDLDADFTVGAGSGPAPGQIGLPEEDINCRCTVTAVLDTERLVKLIGGNGHVISTQVQAAAQASA